MAKVYPCHTNSPEYPPEHRNVYHDDCEEGKKIQRKHRESGTGKSEVEIAALRTKQRELAGLAAQKEIAILPTLPSQLKSGLPN